MPVSTYLRVPVLITDEGAAGDKPEYQLLILLRPWTLEDIGPQLDA